MTVGSCRLLFSRGGPSAEAPEKRQHILYLTLHGTIHHLCQTKGRETLCSGADLVVASFRSSTKDLTPMYGVLKIL